MKSFSTLVIAAGALLLSGTEAADLCDICRPSIRDSPIMEYCAISVMNQECGSKTTGYCDLCDIPNPSYMNDHTDLHQCMLSYHGSNCPDESSSSDDYRTGRHGSEDDNDDAKTTGIILGACGGMAAVGVAAVAIRKHRQSAERKELTEENV